MAEINIEKKKPVWPWIVAGILALLLILFLVGVFDGDDDLDTVAATDVTPVAAAPMADVAPVEPALDSSNSAADMERLAGAFTSDTMQLVLDNAGRFSLQESPAGEGVGTWTYETSTQSVLLSPDDGSQNRHFRVESDDTLVPLDPDGQPAPMMSQLTRQATTDTM